MKSANAKADWKRSYLSGIVNALHDGVIVVSGDLTVLPGTNAAIKKILKCDEIEGKTLGEVLFQHVETTGQKHVKEAVENLILTAPFLVMPEQFDDLAHQVPKGLNLPVEGQSQLRTLRLSFSPMVEDGVIHEVIVLVTDVTEIEDLRNSASGSYRRVCSEMDNLVRLIKSEPDFVGLGQYLRESLSSAREALAIARSLSAKTIPSLLRKAHTIKGGARAFSLSFIQQIFHDLESSTVALSKADVPDGKLDCGSIVELLSLGHQALENLCYVWERVSEEGHSALDDESRWLAWQTNTQRWTAALAADLGKKAALTVHSEIVPAGKDFALFQEVILHLLRNALDHGVEPASLRARQGKQETANLHIDIRFDDKSYLVEVTDDGKGIDREAILNRAREMNFPVGPMRTDKDFLNFLSLGGISTKKATTQISGRGIGLDTVKGALGKAGGLVTMRSSEGTGTSFYMRWPAIEDVSSRRTEESKPKVLIVDDDGDVLEALAHFARKEGMTPCCAASVNEGIEILSREDIGIVLTDLSLPERSGFSLIEEMIRSHPDMPIIVFTGHDTNDVQKAALAAGVLDVVPKHASSSEIRAAFQRALIRMRQQRKGRHE